MKLFGLNISRLAAPSANQRSGLAAEHKGLGLSPAQWLRGEEPGGLRLSSAYEQVVWVYRAINVLAEQVANIPFVFSAGERGRENLITSGPLLEFYSRPHSQLTRFQYWELRVIWLMLRGECVRVPLWAAPDGERNQLTQPAAPRRLSTVFLDPARLQHIVEEHELLGWRYTGFGAQAPLASQVFLPEEVWFEKLPNPFDCWRGLAPLSVAALAAATDFAAGAFLRGLMENNADTGLIVRTDKWLSDEQQEQIVGALRERKRRAGQADRPVLLRGSAEVIRPQLSSSELQFLENRKFSRSEICAAFGVPEELVATSEQNKYDVMAGARLNFIENRVAPLCSRLEAAEALTVQSLMPGASGWFELESLPILQQARRQRLAAARAGFEMGVPFNELNRVLDLGFRALPWGERGYVASNLREVGSPAGPGPDSPSLNPRGATAARAGSGQGPLAVEEAAASECSSLQPGRPQSLPAQATALLGQLCRWGPAALEGPLLEKLSRFLFEQRCRLLAQVAGALAPAEPGLEVVAQTAALATCFNPELGAGLQKAAAATRAAQGLEPEPLDSGFVAQYVQSRQVALEQFVRATVEALAQSLSQGRALNESLEPLRARVRAQFNGAHRRAQLFARTESAAALAAVRAHLNSHPSSL